MKNNSVVNFIKNELGYCSAKNYSDSAGMFNAVIETGMKGRYFIESSRFEGSDRVLQAKEYHLKVITDKHVFKVKTFKGKKEAFDFFDNFKTLKTGALILERFSLPDINSFYILCTQQFINKDLYGNGFTAAKSCANSREILSYCEGDVVHLHSATSAIHEKEVQAHVNHYNENEV